MDLSSLRNDYKNASLDIDHVDNDPIAQFNLWFKEALSAQLTEPNAMSLSTVNLIGQPSSRTVLLKYFDEDGFIFYTNLESQKSVEIQHNPKVALLFTWLELERQVRIEGEAVKVDTATSLKYFASRPRGSQIGAWVSHQSSIISSKSLLLSKFEEIKNKFKNGQIPLPSFWGGYRVVPEKFEFWQGRQNRLHDRICYQKSEQSQWEMHLLAP